jgi:ubiquinone/menaquinone biosynthesis C-methylase UbiE
MSNKPVTGSALSLDALAAKIRLTTAGRRFLDVGAGEGGLVLAWLRQGVDAHGVARTQEVADKANIIAPGRFHCASMSALPFDAQAFDTVVAVDCLDQLAENDVAQAINELTRVCASTLYVKVGSMYSAELNRGVTFRCRKWWEERFFMAGFRKHPAYYQINSYEALENEGDPIELLLEKIPEAAALKYPLDLLQEERDLHMDMFRESGSRSDAHVMRYQWATQYIRPGDTVLDAACGLGYGSYLLQACSTAQKTLGIDGSEYAVNYARDNFAARLEALDFRLGMLPEALAEIPDASVDVIVSFETLEHVQDNVRLLAEFRRVLTPGGRILASVPNDWSDESGEDPNPFHLHVYTLERLREEMEQYFILEALAAQDANQHKGGPGRKQWQAASRSLKDVPLSEARLGQEPCAEWWLSVAMKTPLDGAKADYRETNYPVFTRPDWNVTTFSRDYSNPWLVRSMVDVGHRLRDADALLQLAQSVVAQAPPAAPDVGAALCVMAYQLLNAEGVQASEVDALEGRINAYLGDEPATPHGVRWRISLLFVVGKLWMAHGDFERSERALAQCVTVDPFLFSPLLCNRTVEAWLELGLYSLGRGDLAQAEQRLREGIRQARRAVVDGWDTAMGDVENPAEFSLPELASILEFASSCAFALANLKNFSHKTWWWLHPKRDHLSQSYRLQADHVQALAALRAGREELQKYARQAQVFSEEIAAAHSVANTMQAVIAERDRELDAYRLQAEEYARQVAAAQLHAEHTRVAMAHHSEQAAASQLRMDALVQASEQLRASLAEKDAEMMRVRQHGSDTPLELTAAYRQVAVLSEKVEALESQIAAAHSAANTTQAVIAERDRELGAYRLQAEEYARQVAAAQLHAEHTRVALAHYSEQAAASQLRMDALVQASEQLRASLAEKDAEMMRVRQHGSDTALELIAAHREVEVLSAKVEALESQIAAINSTRI